VHTAAPLAYAKKSLPRSIPKDQHTLRTLA